MIFPSSKVLSIFILFVKLLKYIITIIKILLFENVMLL